MIRSYLCDCILVKGTITVPNMAAAGTVVNNTNKKQYLKIVFHLLLIALPK